MGFNSAFKGLITVDFLTVYVIHFSIIYLHHGDIKSLLLPHTIVSLVYPHSDTPLRFTKEFIQQHDCIPVFLSSFW
jgi:hypothetical protein